MPNTQKDDLDAVREVVEAIKPFSAEEQKRIIKWACEKLGVVTEAETFIAPEIYKGVPPAGLATPPLMKAADIKTFVESKNPRSDKHFAAVVAYYHQFEAVNKKDSIGKDDLVEATRLANWDRLPRPDQTLVNATRSGLLDNISRGQYGLNSVGENLVAMVLPNNDSTKVAPAKKKVKRTQRKKKK